ncbi:phosphatase domain-containing protein [Mycobacterium sp. M26]|uniref:phosphatase domain-containing protein n=1 Tax=Mycobacterium sp. M26 TaxID=1762962 RepID=UPI00073E627F|nr:phosphatase domain-containing protein [Mycobacterium sp. M26]
MPRLPRRIASEFTATLRSPQVAGAVAGIEGKLTARRREQKIQSGAFRGVHVIVYRGFVADDVARVRVRVIEAPELPGDSRIPYWDVAQANLRRHAALHIVGAEVTLRIGAHAATEITDDHGFATFALPVPGLRVGWHTAVAQTQPIEDGETASGTGSVVKPSLRAPFLVISDIDDTILLTGLTEGVAMVTRTLLRDAEQRRAIPGMSALYRGLQRGLPTRSGSRKPKPTFFYVSTGSWSFYPLLEQFAELRDFPTGPMFLTDWGPTERYLRRSGAEHKRTAIRRLFEAYPGMQFVLIGDSGQRDPLTYEEMARDFPGHVKLVLIRLVGSEDDDRNRQVSERAAALRDEGIPLYLVADASEAAAVAHTQGLCDDETLVAVRRALDDD